MAASVLKWFNKGDQPAGAPPAPPAFAPEAVPVVEPAQPAKARFLRPQPNELAIQDLKSLLEISTGQTGRRSEGDPDPGQGVAETSMRGLPDAVAPETPARSRAAGNPLAGVASSALSGPEEIGARVRQRRRALELTQAELAARAGVGKRFMVEVEQGKPTLEVGKLMRVVAACGLTLSIG
jgi:y4mF family transcriptional regulator